MGNFRNPAGGDGRGGRGSRVGADGYRAAFGGQHGARDKRGRNWRPAYIERRDKLVADDERMSVKALPPGGDARVGWLYNMVAATVEEPSTKRPVQAVDLFFIPEDGGMDFVATVIARPYMLVAVPPHASRDVEMALRRDFRESVAEITTVRLEDTSQPNHLALDDKRMFLKLETRMTYELREIKDSLLEVISRNADRRKRSAAVDPTMMQGGLESFMDSDEGARDGGLDGLDYIEDIREYDVQVVNRFAIDRKVNVGYWYRVSPGGTEGDIESVPDETADGQRADPEVNVNAANSFSSAQLQKLEDIVDRANPVVLAYDIECTKQPLKFPDAEAGDQVMMISWMVDGKGFLGINREVVAEDIEDFEYAPHNVYRGDFEVFNEVDEQSLLQRFFQEVRLAAPRVFVTYNGDFFDWPFVESRARKLGLDMDSEIGMKTNADTDQTPQTSGRTAIHMDVFHWVNRDSYLPQGSRGLKNVTRALLGFEPEEIPPEEMMVAARDRPTEMARYSVSDAVCTYYLYMKYVHPFIFSLCNIIPLNPDDVLRKGSGTLCEMLLMCQAHDKRIVAPNKNTDSAIGKLTKDGHVLESETYIGGHVEALRTGVYRSDLPVRFSIDSAALDDLESSLDETLKFAITVEGGHSMDNIENYAEVRQSILDGLAALREKPERDEKPLIYHLDVSAMYPNIILTNRLQPHAIVADKQCASCDFMGTSDCQRVMEWTWRGEQFPASRGEAEMVQRRAAQDERDADLRALQKQREDGVEDGGGQAEGSSGWRGGEEGRSGGGELRGARGGRQGGRGGARAGTTPLSSSSGGIPSFADVEARKNATFRRRLKDYCRTNYRRGLDTRIEARSATVCQRENPFYVDTVRAFRDRRYEYKALLKKQKRALADAKNNGDGVKQAEAERMITLYDSLQLAHKCILNSFYGYVMRRGARWYSMEMAGVVTHTGALIIRRAREFIDRVGLPIELDTDGIWCMLPVSFPENFTFKVKEGKPLNISYICSVFNADVAANFTNHQYQDLENEETLEYSTRSECSILFEVDGPYRAMVLPASLEEGKTIKKRYAVFNDDGSLAELKGFEIKRRGELKLIKEFQGEIFKQFLQGTSLKECYETVGATCNKWLSILTSQGEGMSDAEILDLLVEQNNMSKPLDSYVQLGQKSCAITCAMRMKAFLGVAVTANAGLATYYVVASQPDDAQVTERAIPVQIFDLKNQTLKNKLLRKWTKMADGDDLDLRKLIDWDYYKGRYANAVLKIVSIPAALQAMENPVPGIEYPAWLLRRCRELQDKRKQKTVSSFFSRLPKGVKPSLHSRKALQDNVDDTARLDMVDIEDMPLKQWTEAKRSERRHVATVIRRRKEEQQAAKKMRMKGGTGISFGSFRSRAVDPATREREERNALKALMNAPRPNKRHDFQGWLKHAKKIWRAQRAIRVRRYSLKRIRDTSLGDLYEDEESSDGELEGERPRQRRKLNDKENLDYAPPNFVADMMQHGRRKGQAFFTNTKVTPLLGRGVLWQVVSIVPSPNEAGLFKIWVLPVIRDSGRFQSGDLHCIPLRVNRVLYVSARSSTPPCLLDAVVEETTAVLPRSRCQRGGLFRVEVPEARFRAKDKDLSGALTDALSVDAVFGTKSPLAYEAVLEVGVLCAPKRHVVMNDTSTGFISSARVLAKGVDLDDLVPKNAESVPYLATSLGSNATPLLNQAFLYGSHSLDRTTRSLYMLVAPAARQVSAFFVSSASRAPRINFSAIWTKVISARQDDEPEVSSSLAEALPSDVKFDVSIAKTRAQAMAMLNSALQRLRDNTVTSKNRGAGRRMMVLAQWPTESAAAVSDTEASKRLSLISKSTADLETSLPALSSYPVVRITSNAGDGNFQPVGWESPAVSLALTRFADVSNWLPNQLTLARFSGIPVGNMSIKDVHSQALDVLVGRELRNQDHVLWASESARPDLGGVEEEDNMVSEESIPAPEFSNPGSYRTVCIDTELSDLAVATILASSHVNQLEGTDLAFDAAANSVARPSGPGASGDSNPVFREGAREGEIGGKSVAPLDEMAGSAPAFRVVKGLISKWERASGGEDRIAEVSKDLLDHFYRWIGSESSLLYDPSIARFLSWLIRKMFWQLLAELRSLGAGIVYASSSRLILATPKTRAVDALRYAGFLERTIKSKPLFSHIRFEPLLGVNATMLFVDRFNFGAIPAPEEEAILSGDLSGGDAGGGGRQSTPLAVSRRTYGSRDLPNTRMSWDIARYLPVPVAVLLSQVIEEFIRRPMLDRLRFQEFEEAELEEAQREAEVQQEAFERKCRDEEEAALLENELEADESLGDDEKKAIMAAAAAKRAQVAAEKAVHVKKKPRAVTRKMKPRGDGFEEEVKNFVRSITNDLLEKVQEIREKTPLLQFPDVPTALDTSPLTHRNPSLEFVRTMCHVMSLDRVAAEEVSDLRRNLLRLLGVREFATEARFIDPSLPLILRNTICSFCNAVVDLDLARDCRLWDPASAYSDPSHAPALPWSCEYCSHPYDLGAIELSLLRDAQKLVVAYQVQDVQCRKCKLVKRDNMSMHCSCSGAQYELAMDSKAFYRTIRAMKSVASFHNFELLSQTIDWIDCSICNR